MGESGEVGDERVKLQGDIAKVFCHEVGVL